MKKNYFLTMLMIFASLGSFAQLGTDVYTLGADNSSNYTTSWEVTSEGSGFSDWIFDTSGNGSEGRFLGSFSTALDLTGTSFGLYANNNATAVSGASRIFPKTLQEGDVFKISVGVNFRDGNKGFDLRNSSNGTIINFNVALDKYNLAGTDLYADEYDANTVITFTFTQNATDISWVADRTGGRIESESGTIAAITPGTITNIRLYNTSAGANNDGGAGQRNMFFNSFEFTSKYAINNTSSVIVSTTTTVPYLSIETGSSLTVNSGIGLSISGGLDNNGTLTANSGSSLIVGGGATGNITYNVDVADTDWHLMSSPVEGEGYNTTWVDNNLIDKTTGSGTNVGIATYDNTTDSNGDWIYATDGNTGNFNTGQGYSIKRDATESDVSFTGTLKTTDASTTITANDIGGANENRWTLIGNPFPSFIDVTAFLGLTANGTALENSREALYVWNGTAYTPITTGYIHPGQGFFVNSDVASTSIGINQDMLSHQTGVVLHKNATSNASINLLLNNGTNTKTTEINYIGGKTKGLDRKFDLGTFTGVSSSFNIYTQLVENNEGVDFMLQALPNLDLETIVVPVGVKAKTGEITFSANALNLPEGLKVFLEDRNTNTFTRLDEANSEYKITLTEALNGIGRFYLHTSAKSTLNVNSIALENISIYKADTATLKIVGLQQGNASIKIFNMLGKQMMNSSFKTNGVQEISLPQLTTGVYIVQLTTEAGKLNKKIVLE